MVIPGLRPYPLVCLSCSRRCWLHKIASSTPGDHHQDDAVESYSLSSDAKCQKETILLFVPKSCSEKGEKEMGTDDREWAERS